MSQQIDILLEDNITSEHRNSRVKRQVAISFLSFLPGALIEGGYVLLRYLLFHLLFPPLFILLLLPIAAGLLLSIAAILADVRGRLWRYRRRVGKEQFWRYKVLINPQVYDVSIMSADHTAGVSLQECLESQTQCYILLGASGSGKTKALHCIMQHELEKRFRDISNGKRSIPVFVSLKAYNEFLKAKYPLNMLHAQGAASIPAGTLYDYLYDDKAGSAGCLLPHLWTWISEKRIKFLFDGLNEVDNEYQDIVCAELNTYMDWLNDTIITCRELDYRENAHFDQLSVSDHAKLIAMKPLEEKEQADFIRSHIEKGFANEQGRRWSSTSEQLIDFIKEKQLHLECRNPKKLFTLMQTIDDIGISSEINTLGKLLRESVLQSIDAQQPEWQELDFNKEDLIRYIGEIACTMRRMKCVSGFSLHARSLARYEKPYCEWAEELKVFTEEPPLKNTGVVGRYRVPETTKFSSSRREHMLRFAAKAGLLSISTSNILEFDDKSMEYFVAEFLCVSDTDSRLPYGKELINTEGYWNESIHIWAGLLDDPMSLAHRFGELGIVCLDEEGDRSYNALIAGLMCLGVHWVHALRPVSEQKLPDSLYDLFKSSLANEVRRRKLVAIFERCAQEGSDAVYSPLLKLLTLYGADELLLALPRTPIQNLLFEYLERIADMANYGKDVEALEHILGRMNDDATFQWALAHSKPAPKQEAERSVRLRQVAISVMGALRRKEASSILLNYLSDKDAIRESAMEALRRMKLDDVLPLLLGEIIAPITPKTSQRQLAILDVVGAFLANVSPVGHADIVKQLLYILSSPYQVLHKNAKKLLEEEASSGRNHQVVRESLVVTLVSQKADRFTVHNVQEILIQIGDDATSSLLECLKLPGTKVADSIKIRIIEVIGKTQDHTALDTLYRFVYHTSSELQEKVAWALSKYPYAIVVPKLIDKVLTSQDDEAYAAMQALQVYGPASVELISSRLAATALPARLILLIQILRFFHDRKAIPALNGLLSIMPEPQIAIEIINTLKNFSNPFDASSVMVLLYVLNTPPEDRDVYNAVSDALSQYGEPVLSILLSELKQVQPGGGRRGIMKAISKMQPFPYQALLNALSSSSEAQARYIRALFIDKKKESARFLVKHLCHIDISIQRNVRMVIGELGKSDTNSVIEPFLDQLSESICRNVVVQYLREYAEAAIPALAMRLDDEFVGKIACETLIEMGPLVIDRLFVLIPALNKPQDNPAFRRARQILVEIVWKQQQLPPQVIELFRSLTNDSSKRLAYDALVRILSSTLIRESTPILLQCLTSEHVSVKKGVVETLVMIGRQNEAQSTIVIDELVAALGEEEKRYQAELALRSIGEKAVQSVHALITHSDRDIRKSSRDILSALGALAFEQLFHDLGAPQPELREAAEAIITNMDPEAIKDPLIQLLASSDSKLTEQGLVLLFGCVRADAHAPATHKKMLTVLLEHIQTHPADQQTLPIIAFLLSLPIRQEILDALTQVLSKYPQTQPWLSPFFLLLALEGSKAKDSLLRLIRKGNIPPILYRELIGILGMLEPDQLVIGLAQSIGQYARSFQNTLDLHQIGDVELSRHALGSLLIGGHWDTNQLHKLRSNEVDTSARHELFSVLLGDSYLRRIDALQIELDNEKAMRIQESQGQQWQIGTQKEEIDRLREKIDHQNVLLQQRNDMLIAIRVQFIDSERNREQLTRERDTAQQNEWRFRSEATEARESSASLYRDLQGVIYDKNHLDEELATLRYLLGYPGQSV